MERSLHRCCYQERENIFVPEERRKRKETQVQLLLLSQSSLTDSAAEIVLEGGFFVSPPSPLGDGVWLCRPFSLLLLLLASAIREKFGRIVVKQEEDQLVIKLWSQT